MHITPIPAPPAGKSPPECCFGVTHNNHTARIAVKE